MCHNDAAAEDYDDTTSRGGGEEFYHLSETLQAETTIAATSR